MKKVMFLVFSIFILTGCTTTRGSQTARVPHINSGMSKAQVINTWGEPRAIKTVKNSAQRDKITEQWYYLEETKNDVTVPARTVIFKKDKTSQSYVY